MQPHVQRGAGRARPALATRRAAAAWLWLGLSLLLPSAAHAALPDEIQVYTDAINQPGESGMELHVKTTPKGQNRADYPGEVTTHHGLRVTPEFSYGLTPTLEAGLYLPSSFNAGNWTLAGIKARIKWLPLQPQKSSATGAATGPFAGVNLEVSNIAPKFEAARHNAELRFMLGYRTHDWLFAFNPVFGWALSASQEVPPARNPKFRTGWKVAREISEGISVGAEYYNDKGTWRNFDPGSQQSKTLYAVLDVEKGPVPFNLGIGRGVNGQTDPWTIKAIFGFTF